MSKHVYVDRNVRILTGDEAKAALAEDNDRDFLSEGQGVVRVSEERWEAAQHAERRHWMQLGRRASSDRNDEHFEEFARCAAIQGLSFERAIEIGCGPFTNLRLIGDVCKIEECTLLDPLIKSYLDHPNCAYDERALAVERTDWSLRRRRITNTIANRSNLLRRFIYKKRVPIGEIITKPAELMPTDRQYGLVVMINVLEHCYDARGVFRNIAAITETGGYLVFHDKYYAHRSVEMGLDSYYDAAHPLQVDRHVIDEFLPENFDQVFLKVGALKSFWLGEESSQDTLYYIGKKRQLRGERT